MLFNPNDIKRYNTLCNDGTYSKSSRRSACSWHGGVKQYGVSPSFESPLEAHPAAVYLIPLRDVYFDRALFQNREQEYSEESVQRIVEAVRTGSFRFEVFDPVLLWRRPSDGRLIVLSGHSRTEAFHRLNNAGQRGFDRIPAKIIEVARQEAKKIALESNTLATRETDSERAGYYRQLREKEAIPADEVVQIAKKNEGRNASKIIAYSYLNPNGKTFFALKAIEGKDPTSQENIKNVANWIGSARQRFPMLSNLHEDELFDFLIGGAYGRRFTRMNDFLQKVQAVIYQRTEFGKFDDERPLNIANMAQPTHGEQQYNAIRQELLKSVQTLEKTYKDKIKEMNDRPEATQQDKDRILRPLEMQLRTARQKLLDFEQKATKPSTAAKQELNLFALSGTPNIFRDIDHLITGLFARPAAVGRIVDDAPPGRSLCRDGQFSTYGRGPGRCSYHGGVLLGEMAARSGRPTSAVIPKEIEVQKQDVETPEVSIEQKAKIIEQKISRQIGSDGLIVKAWSGLGEIVIEHQDQSKLYRIGKAFLSCTNNSSEWEKSHLVYGPSIRLRRQIDEILKCDFHIPQPLFPSGHPLDNIENDIRYKDAYEAYRASSFSPERRANSDISGYINYMKETYNNLAKGRTPEQLEALNRWFRIFRQKYREKHNAWNAARSRTASPFVVGPSKFPTASNQKRLATADRRFQELIAFEKKAIDRVKKDTAIYPENIIRQPIKQGESDALQKLRRKLKQAERAHEVMKEVNKIVRQRHKYSEDEFWHKLKDLLPLDVARKIMEPNYAGKVGFEGWQLQNSNQRIKALKDRIVQEERTQTRREEAGARKTEFEGGRIEEDIADNRIRILFDDIPPADLRTKLKRSGWRWSRANKAWQRQATDNAWRSAKNIVGISGLSQGYYFCI